MDLPPPTLLNPTHQTQQLAPKPAEGLLGPSGNGQHNSDASIDLRKKEVLSALKNYFPNNPNAWAGFMGNIQGENSTFDFQKEEIANVKDKGYGLFQFTGEQQEKYFQYLLNTGIKDSPYAQVGYLHHIVYDANPTYEMGNTKRDRLRQNINIGSGYDISDSLVREYEQPDRTRQQQKTRRGLTGDWMELLNVPAEQSKPTPRKPYNVYRNRYE